MDTFSVGKVKNSDISIISSRSSPPPPIYPLAQSSIFDIVTPSPLHYSPPSFSPLYFPPFHSSSLHFSISPFLHFSITQPHHIVTSHYSLDDLPLFFAPLPPPLPLYFPSFPLSYLSTAPNSSLPHLSTLPPLFSELFATRHLYTLPHFHSPFYCSNSPLSHLFNPHDTRSNKIMQWR